MYIITLEKLICIAVGMCIWSCYELLGSVGNIFPKCYQSAVQVHLVVNIV